MVRQTKPKPEEIKTFTPKETKLISKTEKKTLTAAFDSYSKTHSDKCQSYNNDNASKSYKVGIMNEILTLAG
jgi:hypothetical protein